MQPSPPSRFDVPYGVDRYSKFVRERGGPEEQQDRGEDGIAHAASPFHARAHDTLGNDVGSFRADKSRELNSNLLERIALVDQTDEKRNDYQNRRD